MRRIGEAGGGESVVPVTGLTETTDFHAENVTLTGSRFTLTEQGTVSLPNDDLAKIDTLDAPTSIGEVYAHFDYSLGGQYIVASTNADGNSNVEFVLYDQLNSNVILQDTISNVNNMGTVTVNDAGGEIFLFYRNNDFTGEVKIIDDGGAVVRDYTSDQVDFIDDACFASGSGRAIATSRDSYIVVRSSSSSIDGAGQWNSGNDHRSLSTVGQNKENYIAGSSFDNYLEGASLSFPTLTDVSVSTNIGVNDVDGFTDVPSYEYAVGFRDRVAIYNGETEQQQANADSFGGTTDGDAEYVAVLQDVGLVAVGWQDDFTVRLHQRSDLTESASTIIPYGNLDGDKKTKVTQQDGNVFSTYEVATLDSAEAFIEFDRPGYLFGWDAAVLTSETDGTADVTVDVQENDGTGWVTVEQDVPRQAPIASIPPDNDVRLKATLTRSDSSDDATIVYAGIRHQK